MQLLYPIGLFALAGLIIPVVIHLWNIKKGKTLKIGSIALLGESAKASSRSLYIKDWPLFILRCLLVILMAFLLAQPYQKKSNTSKKQGWILIKKPELKQVYALQKQKIDSLLQQGFELHDFTIDFAQILLKDTMATVDAGRPDLSYTSLIKQLNTKLPAGFNVYLFADRRLAHFNGDLPRVALNLKWINSVSTDTLSKWQSTLRGKSYEAISSPSLTTYAVLNSPTNHSEPITALIYANHAADADYIRAALNAIADYTKTRIEINTWGKQANGTKASLGFWLSDEPIKASDLSMLNQDANLFTYEKGKEITVSSTLNLVPRNAQSHTNVALYKRIEVNLPKGEKIWTDGFGSPVLTKEKSKDHNQYHFYSRFNPSWTDLVWNDQFVKAMLPLVLAGDGFENHPNDQRNLAMHQKEVMPTYAAAVTAKNIETKPLNTVLWLMALLLLIAERFLSFRHTNKLNELKS